MRISFVAAQHASRRPDGVCDKTRTVEGRCARFAAGVIGVELGNELAPPRVSLAFVFAFVDGFPLSFRARHRFFLLGFGPQLLLHLHRRWARVRL